MWDGVPVGIHFEVMMTVDTEKIGWRYAEHPIFKILVVDDGVENRN
jgi:hypothetical protein